LRDRAALRRIAAAYNVRMKVTRRNLARIVAISAAVPAALAAQTPPRSASDSDALLNAARQEVRDAGRVLAAVKLPREVEPAARFEA